MTLMTLTPSIVVVRGLLICLVWASSAAGGQVAAATELGAIRWPPGVVVRVWIDPEGAPRGAVDLVARAAVSWARAAAGAVTLERVSDQASASIDVHFLRGAAVYGEARPRTDPRTGFIVGATVIIGTNIVPDPVDRQIVLYLTAVHELGHALGLPHTDDFETIMYRFRQPDDGARFFGAYRRLLGAAADIGSPQASGVSDRDARTLKALYGR